MATIFNVYLLSFVLILLDDVLVFSKNVQEHEKHMRLVFHTLRQANLKLKPKKCRLFQESVTYLGYKLSPEGIAPDENKLLAVRDWKRPESVTEVRSFIGVCSYYRRFIKDFAGAVLSNIVDGVEYPVALASRVLTPAECRYSTTKKEALAVIQAMKCFKPYIWGTQFVLRTDHASLQWLFRQNNDGRIFRMLQRLQEFNFQVVHRPGDKHGNADGLSRQCRITPELTEAERQAMFGSCPSANSLEDALGRINLATVGDVNEPMSIQFQEDSLRLAQGNDPCLRLILQWANAEKHPDQNPLRDLKIKKANAIAQGEDAVAMWGLWDQMELTDGVL